MKLKALALAVLAFSSVQASANPLSPYDLRSVNHDEVISWMVPGTDATGTPENLQGLWWMNGNPLADEVVSFAGVKWEEVLEDGEVVGYTGALPVYDEGVWSWHGSLAGLSLYNLVLSTKLVYVAEFNKDFSYGVVTPTFQPLKNGPTIKLDPSKFVTFTMKQVDENEYARDSIILTLPSTYRFRRIVDGNGTVLQANYAEFLQKVEAQNAILPFCKISNGFENFTPAQTDEEGNLILSSITRTVPTPCAK